MSWDNKIVWSEGLFLRPQHFQQSDRYFEKLIRSRVAALRPYGWGFTVLKLNREMLALGRLAIDEAQGVLEDGTPFSIPDDADHPVPLEIAENIHQPGALEAAPVGATESVARFTIEEQEIGDATAPSRARAGLEIGRLRLRLVVEGADRAGLVGLGLVHITELRSDGQIVLDDGFIAPTLDCAASKNLSGFIVEIQGLLHQRGEALGGRVAASGTKGVAELSDLLLLQVVNRYEPLFSHFMTTQHLHPETFYMHAIQLAGELTTFLSADKRTPSFPPYRHDDLSATFTPLMRVIRELLSAVVDRTAVPIPLQERKHGVKVAIITDRTLVTSASFILSVKADVEAERLRRFFPSQVKVGPVETFGELVRSALPGIAVRALPVAPRQIPFHVGSSYFELDRTSAFWKAMLTSGGLALFVAGEFPGLEMELWAIRGQ
jgi:type VI secretion system protein ImpJ